MAVSDQLIGAAIAQSQELLLLLDPTSLEFVYSNFAAEAALGYAKGELCELSPHDLFPEFLPPELTAVIEGLSLSDQKSVLMNTVLVSKLAGMRDYALQLQCVDIDQKALILISGRDVTAQMAESDQVQAMLADAQMNSMLDPATGLLQRVYFLPYLHAVMLNAVESKKAFGLMLFDLDNLSRIYEEYGHLAGERVLLHVGQIVKRVVEVPEFSARFSEDKLCLLLPRATKSSVQELVSHLMRAMGRLSYSEWPELKVKARMGIYLGYPDADPEVLLERIGEAYQGCSLEGSDLLTLLSPNLDE